MKVYIILFIFLIGIITGYSLHNTKEKIEIHEEATRIFNEYQTNKVDYYNNTIKLNITEGVCE